jgi:hypothetical protein
MITILPQLGIKISSAVAVNGPRISAELAWKHDILHIRYTAQLFCDNCETPCPCMY